jgi:hypothetical protein
MGKDTRYEPLSVDDVSLSDQWNRLNRLTRRQRLRLHVGGLLFIGLGVYIIWRTLVLIFGLFPQSSTHYSWQNTRYMFVLYLSLVVVSDCSGDSYSSIKYDVHGPHPSEMQPFGNPPYPGETTAGGPNWVFFMIHFSDNRLNIL